MLWSIRKQSRESVESVMKKKRWEGLAEKVRLGLEWKSNGVMNDETNSCESMEQWKKCHP